MIIPERRSAEVTPAVCKAWRGRSSTSRSPASRNLADSCGAKDGRLLGLRRAAEATTRYDQPDYTGGIVAVLGAEGKGPAPRVARCATTSSRCLCAGASNRST